MANPILNLLRNNKLQTLVVKILDDICFFALTTHKNPPEDMKHLTDIDLWEEAWWRAQAPRSLSDIKEAFEENIFAKMNEPLPIIREEFLDAFWAAAKPVQYQLIDDPHKYAEGVYTVFINTVANQMFSYDSFPLTVARVYEPCCGTFAECPEGVVHVPRKIQNGENWLMIDSEEDRKARCILVDGKIWDRRYIWIGEDFDGVETSPCTDIGGLQTTLQFLSMRVGGIMSEQARSELTNDLSRILPSLIRSIAVIQETLTRASENAFVITCKLRLPVITEALIGKNLCFLRRCLDAYYSRPSKKDSMDRRIKNAVSLLAESDTQTNDAIGLALSVAAIEALLGQKGEGLTEKLSNDLAVLLEPNLEMRTKAKKFFKDLYEHRSAALHGRDLENKSENRNNGRRIAAAVLFSVVSRQDFLQRGDFEPDTPEELLRDLRNCHWSAGQPMGIPELAVVRLWREPLTVS
jgi:hypothetical protein